MIAPTDILTDRRSITHFVGEAGEEVADYSINYRPGTQTKRSVSVNLYKVNVGTEAIPVYETHRADWTDGTHSVTSDTALEMSVNYSKDLNLDNLDLIIDEDYSTQRRSITHFTGEAGDEIADYTENFRISTDTLRSVSVNFYEADKRASDASVTSDSKLTKSVSFSKDFDIADIA